MKQEGKVVAKKGTTKVVIKFDEQMPSDVYSITKSVIDGKSGDQALVQPVAFSVRTKKGFTIHFVKKLPHKLTIAWCVEAV